MTKDVEVYGSVSILCGDTVICDKTPNAIVRQGMRHIMSYMVMSYFYLYAQKKSAASTTVYFGSTGATLRVGKSNISTIVSHDELVSQIALAPSTFSRYAISAPSNERSIRFTAIFNAGVLNPYLATGETIGEVGLYLSQMYTLSFGYTFNPGTNVSYTFPSILFARVGLNNGAFVPSLSEKVTIIWDVGCKFV